MVSKSSYVYQDWEVIADNIFRAGWSWGYCTAKTETSATLFVVDAHKTGHGHHVVRSDDPLAAFKELEKIVRATNL